METMGQELKSKSIENQTRFIKEKNLLNETDNGTGSGGINGPIGGMIGGPSTGGLEI
jgi:hypothetical protein